MLKPDWWALVMGVLLLVPWLEAHAARMIDPGEAANLKAGEGLLVVAVEAHGAVDSVKISQDGRVLGAGIVLARLPPGRTVQLYAVDSGDYAWHEATLYAGWQGVRYQLWKNSEYRFRVEPGKLNYPGELVVRGRGSIHRADFHFANRSLPVIDWLEASHPAVAKEFPLHYSGRYPDPFPAFYRAERAAWRSAGDLDSGLAVPKAEILVLDPKLLWSRPRVAAIALSPDGTLLAEATYRGDSLWQLELLDLVSGESRVLATIPLEYEALQWKDDRTLVAEASRGTIEQRTLYLVSPGPGKRTVQARPFPLRGRIVDLLPRDPGQILFERFDSTGKLVVHRVEVGSPEGLYRMQHLKSKDRLNWGVKEDLAWYSDGSGELRACLVLRDDEYRLLHGRAGSFREVLSLGADSGFRPVMLSRDGETIFGLDDSGRGQRDLVVFDPSERQVTRTVFSKPGVDIASVIFDDRREPIAVRYYLSGRLVTEYFDPPDRLLSARLESSFPESNVAVIDRSRDQRQLILWVERSDRPARLYHLDTEANRASLIDEVTPDLAGRPFIPARVLQARSRDGLAIEALLTMPASNIPVPLVVMPHGGPVGVADRLHFDREVQFIASLGYAVLQVNFRGSEGYGRAFREAGRGSFGTRIEDDIDAALSAALDGFPLDRNRMCLLGSSYGGYSAMISTLRWPGRFRCAVSMHGITDRPLLFTASDSARSDDLRQDLVRTLGDPNVELDGMLATSPLYRYRQLDTPLLLVHGRGDLRVDFEHTRRLVRMLNLAGKKPVVMAFQDAGHGLDRLEDIEIAWRGIAGFLRLHLGQGRAVAADPGPGSTAGTR